MKDKQTVVYSYNGLLLCNKKAATWMNLKNIMLTEKKRHKRLSFYNIFIFMTFCKRQNQNRSKISGHQEAAEVGITDCKGHGGIPGITEMSYVLIIVQAYIILSCLKSNEFFNKLKVCGNAVLLDDGQHFLATKYQYIWVFFVFFY